MTSAPVIFALAGVNGAGKSSVVGTQVARAGGSFFNPDEAAAAMRNEFGYSTDEANSRAWQDGKNRLEAAISNRESYTFESTLGANTIPQLLAKAAEAGFDVVIWFVGLSSPREAHSPRSCARCRGRTRYP